MTPQYFVEQFGVWGLIVIFAGILLKYVMKDLRTDNERNYSMMTKLHDRQDNLSGKLEKVLGMLERMNGKLTDTIKRVWTTTETTCKIVWI